MLDALLFIVLPIAFLFCYMAIKLRSPKAVIPYLKTMRGAATGIYLFVGASVAMVIVTSFIPRANAVETFTYAEVYMGMDWTFSQSPQCKDDGMDKYATSNGGIRLNMLKIDRLEINTKYTHHSCAFNNDRNGYDGAGIEFMWRVDLK